ncbi:hypothetical protein [Streptosporangium sp. G12]
MRPQQPPKKQNPRLVGLAVLAVAVVALVGMAALFGGEPERAAQVTTVLPTPNSSPAPVSGVPKPDAQQTMKLLLGLRRIDSALDYERSIDRARNSCSDLLAGEDRAAVIRKTQQRFDGAARIDIREARTIVKLIEDGGWCR